MTIITMLEITTLGGGQEIGRSSFLVDTGVEKFLIDYGLNSQNFTAPIEPPANLDAVLLSHAHLDHCGMIPALYNNGYINKVFATKTTLELSELLLRDSIKIQERKGLQPQYFSNDIQKMMQNSEAVELGEKLEFSKTSVQMLDAGHIPGSSSILLESGKTKLLYTGDIKYIETALMNPAYKDYKNIDAMMIESTYSYQNHTDRDQLVQKLKDKIKETVGKDGIVLLPSFAIGRTQEMLLLLSDIGVPIYMDGMGIDATRIILNNPDSVKDPEKLKKAFGKAHKVEDIKDRKNVLNENCVVIASAGMLQGGPMHYYLRKLYKKENCLMIFNGFQPEGTTGRAVLEKHRIIDGNSEVEVRMGIEFMDFSAHIGKDNLYRFIEQVNPKKVIPVHGGFVPEFVAELKRRGFDAVGPKNGDVVKI